MAGKDLVEISGLNVDLGVHAQVLERTKSLDKAP